MSKPARKRPFDWLDLAVIIVCLAALAVLSFSCSRRQAVPLLEFAGQSARLCKVTQSVALALGDAEDSATQAAVRSAVSYWDNVLGGGALHWVGNLSYGSIGIDHYGLIPIQIMADSQIVCLSQGCGCTLLWLDKSRGCTHRAVIIVRRQCAGKMDELETIVRHELGHAYGLGDDYDNVGRLMYYQMDSTVQHPLSLSGEELSAVQILAESGGGR